MAAVGLPVQPLLAASASVALAEWSFVAEYMSAIQRPVEMVLMDKI